MLLSYDSARVFECVRTVRENRAIARAEARDRNRDRRREIAESDGFPGATIPLDHVLLRLC